MDEPGYQSGTTAGGKWGCAASVLTGLIVFVPLWFLAFFGDCPPDAQCHNGEMARAIGVIVTTTVAALTIGVIVRWLINR